MAEVTIYNEECSGRSGPIHIYGNRGTDFTVYILITSLRIPRRRPVDYDFDIWFKVKLACGRVADARDRYHAPEKKKKTYL